MAMTIRPAVSGIYGRSATNTATYLGGVAVGAALSAAVAITIWGTLELLLGRPVATFLAFPIVVLAVMRDFGFSTPVPYGSRQVPEALRSQLSQRTVALVYGTLLGFAFLTPFTSSAHLAFMIMIPVLAPSAFLLALLFYTLGKGLVLYLGVGASHDAEIETRISGIEGLRSRQLLRALATGSLSVSACLTMLVAVYG